ncbi:MFS transporter [Tenggerimyces flavus]|uniref:Major facilitator superfamily (MFS) profile domain-containing protein n=1 Tax=Tenggerimyces flavus TaxID=1708749 RepID=A0ABV7YCR9_9ACTN
MVGAAITPLLARRIGSARIVWMSLAVTGPFAALAPLAQPGLLIAVFVLSLAAGELGQIVYSITANNLRQQLCPNELLGRVGATMRFLVMGSFPIGALAGGLLGGTIGVRGTLWIVGGVTLIASVPPFVTLRHVRGVEQLTRPAP